MATSLSEDEFHRMQLQLLELRTSTYQLEDKCKRQERELETLRGQFENAERELQKSNRTIYKSKKAKEFELLEQENDGLQRKLHSQEEEFRLQNETLMHELGQVVTTNEALEKENQELQGSRDKANNPESQQLVDDVRRLQAENSALQKNLTACQEKQETERAEMRQMISDLEAQCFKLSGQRGTPVGAGSSESRTVEGQCDADSVDEDVTDFKQSMSENPNDQDIDSDVSSDILSLSADKQTLLMKIEQHTRVISDLELKLDTEKEEKKILKEQMSKTEEQDKNQIKSLQEEVEKITEKFKKKQESLVQLQEEKELIYTELRNQVHDVEVKKDAEINQLKGESDRLQEEISQCNQVLEDYEQKSHTRIYELESLVNSLESRVSDATMESSQQLEEKNSEFQNQLQVVTKQLEDHKKALSDLQTQLRTSQSAYDKMKGELLDTKHNCDEQIHALQESNKVAEKRKSLLDELAIKYQEEADQHREQVKRLEESHQAEVDLLSDQLTELQHKLEDLEEVKVEADSLRGQVHSLNNTKGWLERRLNETEDSFNQTKLEHEGSMEQHKQEHQTELQALEENHQQYIKELESRLEDIKKEKTEKEQEIEKLKQEIKDSAGERKITEKKGATMLKDLKRQLHQERKRADKLQERLQELLSDSRSRQSVEELFRPIDPNDKFGDASSVSSWNASVLSRDTLAMSPDEENAPVSLERENSDLLKRLADIQQDKWMLEEKVSHLESSNSCMAEDLLQKTAVIEHYVMDSRIESAAQSPSTEKISLKRMMDLIKSQGDENLREMNKKLQNMLEETLTKNMHLQKDMEVLSQEIVRLSKQVVTSSPTHVSSGEQSAN